MVVVVTVVVAAMVATVVVAIGVSVISGEEDTVSDTASDVKAIFCPIHVWCCCLFEWPLMFEQPPLSFWHNHSYFS